MKKIILVLSLLISQLAFGITGAEVLKKMDDLGSLESDGTAKVRITTQKTGQAAKVQDMQWFRQDSTNSFLIRIQSPAAEKGNGYLKNGDNLWLYKKNTRTFQFINSSESIGGSGATADDFDEKTLSEEYTVVGKIEELKLGSRDVYKFEVKGRNKNVKDPKRIYWVDKATFLPLRQQNFSLSGTLLETIEYSKYSKVAKSFVAGLIKVTDEFDKGNITIVEISAFSTDKIDSKVFTKAYLENLSK